MWEGFGDIKAWIWGYKRTPFLPKMFSPFSPPDCPCTPGLLAMPMLQHQATYRILLSMPLSFLLIQASHPFSPVHPYSCLHLSCSSSSALLNPTLLLQQNILPSLSLWNSHWVTSPSLTQLSCKAPFCTPLPFLLHSLLQVEFSSLKLVQSA